jgi:hypothetical protein
MGHPGTDGCVPGPAAGSDSYRGGAEDAEITQRITEGFLRVFSASSASLR